MRGPLAILILLGVGVMFLMGGRARGGAFTSRGATAAPQPITTTRPTFQAPRTGITSPTARPTPIAGTTPSPPAVQPTRIVDITTRARPSADFVLVRSETTGRVIGGRSPAASEAHRQIVAASGASLAERVALERDLLFDK